MFTRPGRHTLRRKTDCEWLQMPAELCHGHSNASHLLTWGFAILYELVSQSEVIYAVAHVRGGGELGRDWLATQFL